MAIPSQEIGYGTEEKLLWQISKQIQNLIGVTYNSGSGFSTTYVPYTGATSNVNLDGHNISANAFINGFSSITASGTQVVLTVDSAPEILVSGSGGQTIKLPDATTLANGTTFTFNNNQSSGAISVNNNSNTLVASIPSGGYVSITLLSNSIAAGTWDRHDLSPANVSWSTNTFDYPGSITSATWNGTVIAPNRGGTGQSTYTDGQLLIGNTTGNTLSKSTLTPGTGISITNGNGSITITATGAVSGAVTGSGTTNYVPKFTSSTVVGNSNIQDSGTTISLGSETRITSGSLAIGAASLTGRALAINKSITGATTSVGMVIEGSVQSDVTNAYYYQTFAQVQNTVFTLSNCYHYIARGNFTGSATVTNQYAFYAEQFLISATNNYGFYGNIASGTNRWNLYMAGTASNYLAGKTGIGDFLSITGGTNTPSGLGNGVHISFQGNIGYIQSVETLVAGRQLNIMGAPLFFGNSNLGTLYGTFTTSGNFILQNGGTFTDAGYRLDVNGTTRLQGDTIISSGGLGIGISPQANYGIRLSRTITSNVDSTGISSEGQIQSDVTNTAHLFSSVSNTQATTFTLSLLRHFVATQGTFGSGSTITTQIGFLAQSNLTGATNNYGFQGSIPSGSNRWNLYMSGTADNYMAGSLGIGIISLTQYSLRVAKNITGNVFSYGISQSGIVQSDVTSAAWGFQNQLYTQATTFTLSSYYHYFAQQQTIGSGSTVNNQSGFHVDSSLIGATNNYAFRGQIPSGTNRWNIYMDGTADNYMAGGLGIGTTSLGNATIRIGKLGTGAINAFGIDNQTIFQSDVTNGGTGFNSYLGTQAASFTLVNFKHYNASVNSIGAGSTITRQYGFNVDSSCVGATNNFGFVSSIPSATNNWNLYLDGTAQNYLKGALSIGVTTANASALLQVDSTTQGVLFPRMTTTQKNAISSPATGLVVFDTTLGKLCVYSTTWQTISSL